MHYRGRPPTGTKPGPQCFHLLDPQDLMLCFFCPTKHCRSKVKMACYNDGFKCLEPLTLMKQEPFFLSKDVTILFCLYTFLRYMKGRVSYEQLNAVVTCLNTAVTAKYKILHQTMKTLNNHSRKLQQRFKEQETIDTRGILSCPVPGIISGSS